MVILQDKWKFNFILVLVLISVLVLNSIAEKITHAKCEEEGYCICGFEPAPRHQMSPKPFTITVVLIFKCDELLNLLKAEYEQKNIARGTLSNVKEDLKVTKQSCFMCY